LTLGAADITDLQKVNDRLPESTPVLSMSLIRERVGSPFAREQADRLWLASQAAEARGAAEKRAAVATILRDGLDGPEVLLIRRAEHPQDPWSGHMAFPGGRECPSDRDLLATAVRETREEMSLDLERSGRLLGRLHHLPAVARGRRVGLTIAPYVFELTGEAVLSPNHEVSEFLWTPLSPLMRGAFATTIPYEFEGQRVLLPAHEVQGRVVWGLTYRMLESLFALLR
jgi:8-oxo-dGTP pyrophosphatase MutT (NUDIX family)